LFFRNVGAYLPVYTTSAENAALRIPFFFRVILFGARRTEGVGGGDGGSCGGVGGVVFSLLSLPFVHFLSQFPCQNFVCLL
jgi:hypothetical protein